MMGKYRQRISSGIVMPLQQFIKREKSAGIVLGLSIVAAMALATRHGVRPISTSSNMSSALSSTASHTSTIRSITGLTTG